MKGELTVYLVIGDKMSPIAYLDNDEMYPHLIQGFEAYAKSQGGMIMERVNDEHHISTGDVDMWCSDDLTEAYAELAEVVMRVANFDYLPHRLRMDIIEELNKED